MEQLNKQIQQKFAAMQQTGKLFRVALTGQEIWSLYLSAFTKENNPKFRDPASSYHNCNHCNNFGRRYGNVVSIDANLNITTMFDIEADEEYADSLKVMSTAIKSSTITEVFFETIAELKKLKYDEVCNHTNKTFQLGVDKNVKRYTTEESEKYVNIDEKGNKKPIVKPNEIRTFNHIHLHLNKEFVDTSGKSVEAIMGNYRDAKNVFQRAMETIPLDTLQLVRDLILQGSLLDGTAHLYKIEAMIPLKKEYVDLAANQRDNWCWLKSYKFQFAKFRNELIGVLCTELAEGEELNKACQTWNKRVDPVNYMKTTAPITKRQIEDARKFVEENGYTQSFDRRFATIDDIKVSEILHSNVGDGKLKTISIFDQIKPAPSTRHKRSEFANIEEVSIEKFMKDILPTCTSVEAFLSNGHENNMVSLTTANNKDSKPIFKWSNNYSKTFNGNLAGKSQIKEAVKSAGGKVDGVLRFSIIWNEDGQDIVDFDAHAYEPDGTHIYFSSNYRKDRGNYRTSMTGQLDVDMVSPHHLGVENIVHVDIKRMKNGKYKFQIHNFSGSKNKGFKAEIEMDGEIFNYEVNQQVMGYMDVAEVTLNDGQFTINHLITEATVSSKNIYGLESNQFHKVNLMCLSPNHWAENNVGNKYYLFMLQGCKSPTAIRSFHNEDLLPELAQHRKVLEVLGATSMIESTDKQLSGLGFNSTVKDELIVKLQGNFKRMLKIKFG